MGPQAINKIYRLSQFDTEPQTDKQTSCYYSILFFEAWEGKSLLNHPPKKVAKGKKLTHKLSLFTVSK